MYQKKAQSRQFFAGETERSRGLPALQKCSIKLDFDRVDVSLGPIQMANEDRTWPGKLQ